jgi:hypothetical protein
MKKKGFSGNSISDDQRPTEEKKLFTLKGISMKMLL